MYIGNKYRTKTREKINYLDSRYFISLLKQEFKEVFYHLSKSHYSNKLLFISGKYQHDSITSIN